MVGDNKEWDIDPAQNLGIATYWVDGEIGYTQQGLKAPFGIGPLERLLEWIESTQPEDMVPEFNSPAANIAILRSSPAAIATKVSNLDQARWHINHSNNGWNLTEIICHLRDVDREIYIPRITQVLNSKRPFIEAVDAEFLGI